MHLFFIQKFYYLNNSALKYISLNKVIFVKDENSKDKPGENFFYSPLKGGMIKPFWEFKSLHP